MVYYEHMKKISILLSLLITTLATSCGNGLNPNPNPPEPPEPESPYHIVDPSFACPIRGSQSEVTYTDLFNLGNKVSISIDITLEELQKIYNDNDYDNKNKPETYRRADSVTISMLNGNNTYTWTFENVGI